MKKIFTTMALLSISGLAIAQNQIDTYSVYDVNHDNITSVADATKVVSRAIEEIKADPQVVDAATINELLNEINQNLKDLKKELSDVKQRVNFVMKESGMDYSAYEPDENGILSNGHEYVDLGLPSGLKWATCNVGAEIPEDVGLYFAWGETIGYGRNVSDGHRFDWTNYKWGNGQQEKVTKYNTSYDFGPIVDNKYILDAADDAAHINWGGKWRTPTKEEIKELWDNCTIKHITRNGMEGMLFSRNSKSIFLPAAESRSWSDISNEGCWCYWSSSCNSLIPCSAYRLFSNGYQSSLDYGSRSSGYSIRPVIE